MNAPWHTLLGSGDMIWHDMLRLHIDHDIPCSCGCNRPLFVEAELHHGILSKARAMKIKGNRRLIDHPYNCFLVNHSCHQRIPGPDYFWGLACERYGRANVREWYAKCQKMFKRTLERYGEEEC